MVYDLNKAVEQKLEQMLRENPLRLEFYERYKEIVEEYKEGIKALDDDLFVEIVDELKSKLDLTRFNELLDLESFDEDQAQEVEKMIDISTDIICLHLQHKIQGMVELYEKF